MADMAAQPMHEADWPTESKRTPQVQAELAMVTDHLEQLDKRIMVLSARLGCVTIQRDDVEPKLVEPRPVLVELADQIRHVNDIIATQERRLANLIDRLEV